MFMSSLAMNGEGRGIVVRTGDNTMIGKIATLASDTNTHRSTLQVGREAGGVPLWRMVAA